MACDYTALSAYLDGELGEARRRLVEAHVKECSDCAAELQSLERVKTMLTACAIPAGMHGRLAARLELEERKQRVSFGKAGWLLAATAATVLLAAALYFNMKPSGGGPEMPAVLPLLTQNAPSERQELAQVEVPKPAAPATTEPAKPMEETKLALQLTGTVKGALPQAVILRTDTGKSATYGIGEEVLPGLRVAEVRDKEVVLADDQGNERTLSIGHNPAPEVKTLAGAWEGTFSERVEGLTPEKAKLIANDDGGKVTMRVLASGNGDEAGPVFKGQRTGQQLTLTAEINGRSWRLDGQIDTAFEKVTGSGTKLSADSGDAAPEAAFELIRITEDAVREEELREETDAARKAELSLMYQPLKAYADAHDGKFPDALSQLVPIPLSSLAIYANTPERAVEYLPGATTKPWTAIEFETFRPELAMGERLVAYEQQLQLAWGSEVPVRFVLKVTYKASSDGWVDTYHVSVTGGLSKVTGNDTSGGGTVQELIASDRAKSQNNLKQLALIVKMFENEHKGITPPGWLTVYPEYLTDASVCTAPWDEPGTNSYQLLFPGSFTPDVEALAGEIAMSGKGDPDLPKDPSDPAFAARAQACTPFIIEKHADPRAPGGRNVAFLDGHVQYVKNAEWSRIVGPFTR